MSDQANIKDENIVVFLTEWEKDTLIKALYACQYPGSHVQLVANLYNKINAAQIQKEENNNIISGADIQEESNTDAPQEVMNNDEFDTSTT